MPNPAVITMMQVPANSAPASSMANWIARASLATALVRAASFAVVTKRRKARSALRSNPVNAHSGRMARKSCNRHMAAWPLEPGRVFSDRRDSNHLESQRNAR